MAIRASDLIMNAVARSGRAQQDILLNQPAEILDRINYVLRRWFTFAARANRGYFGVVAQSTFNTGRWPKPADAESIWGLVGRADTVPPMAGEPIDPVPYDEQTASRRAVISLGRYYLPISGVASTNPTGGTIDILYSRTPQLLSVAGDLSQTIDPDWPESQVEILEVDLAIWVAARHDLPADVERLTAILETKEAEFLAHLGHYEAGLVSSRNSPRPITPASQANG